MAGSKPANPKSDVGGRGWIGVELDVITDEALAILVREAGHITAPKRLRDREAGIAVTRTRRRPPKS